MDESFEIDPRLFAAAATIATLIKQGFNYESAEKYARSKYPDLPDETWQRIQGGHDSMEHLFEQFNATCLFIALACCGYNFEETEAYVLKKYPDANINTITKVMRETLEAAQELTKDDDKKKD